MKCTGSESERKGIGNASVPLLVEVKKESLLTMRASPCPCRQYHKHPICCRMVANVGEKRYSHVVNFYKQIHISPIPFERAPWL